MAALISITLFMILMAAITWVGYRYYTRPARFYEQLGTAVAGTGFGVAATDLPEGTLVRVVRNVGEKVPVSPEDARMTRRYLIAAGFRSDSAVSIYYGIKVLACGAMLSMMPLLNSVLPPILIFKLILMGALLSAGFFVPNLVLERLVDRRQEKLRLGLPDALDLMVVSVEAGLGLDQAISKVSQELSLTHPDICDEFRLVTLEMQAGKRRAESLRHLAERTGEEELKKLAAILIQTDRFGTSMGDSLRTHADFMRIRRRQLAEERAGKIAIKLVFVIFFFVLPTTIMVVAGPSILMLVKDFEPMMRTLKGQ